MADQLSYTSRLVIDGMIHQLHDYESVFHDAPLPRYQADIDESSAPTPNCGAAEASESEQKYFDAKLEQFMEQNLHDPALLDHRQSLKEAAQYCYQQGRAQFTYSLSKLSSFIAVFLSRTENNLYKKLSKLKLFKDFQKLLADFIKEKFMITYFVHRSVFDPNNAFRIIVDAIRSSVADESEVEKDLERLAKAISGNLKYGAETLTQQNCNVKNTKNIIGKILSEAFEGKSSAELPLEVVSVLQNFFIRLQNDLKGQYRKNTKRKEVQLDHQAKKKQKKDDDFVVISKRDYCEKFLERMRVWRAIAERMEASGDAVSANTLAQMSRDMLSTEQFAVAFTDKGKGPGSSVRVYMKIKRTGSDVYEETEDSVTCKDAERAQIFIHIPAYEDTYGVVVSVSLVTNEGVSRAIHPYEISPDQLRTGSALNQTIDIPPSAATVELIVPYDIGRQHCEKKISYKSLIVLSINICPISL